jgi:hypothetical protein
MAKDDFAIVIGIDTYPALRRLRAAVKDSAKFLEWLTSPIGGDVPADNIRHIQSPPQNSSSPFSTEARPLQGQIDEALVEFGVNNRMRIGRRLYFYFAGHGLGTTFEDVGMLMANATMTSLRSNIGLKGYQAFLHENGYFDEVVFILDCCRDQAINVGTGVPPFTFVSPPPPPRTIESLVILAAQFGEKAFEPSQATENGVEPRGILTQALLEGLNGQAANALGEVTAFTLRDYLMKRVKDLALPRLNQDPSIQPVLTKDIVFRVAPVEMVDVTIIAPPGIGGELILTDGQANELARRAAVDAEEGKSPWTTSIRKNARYQVAHSASQVETLFDPRRMQQPLVHRFPIPA